MVIIEKSKEQKITDMVLYAVMGVSLLVLGLFYFWGYDTPYEENPDFVNPSFTDGLIIYQIILFIITAIAAVCSAVHSMFVGRGKAPANDKVNIAEKVAGPTSWAILIISIIVGLIYGITFQNEEMIINNTAWQNPSDSILTDTCMWSISILMVGTIASIVYSMFGSRK